MNIQTQIKSKTMDTANEMKKRINRVEDDLRFLIKNAACEDFGAPQDCVDKFIMHCSRALDQATKGHKCAEQGANQSSNPAVQSIGDKG